MEYDSMNRFRFLLFGLVVLFRICLSPGLIYFTMFLGHAAAGFNIGPSVKSLVGYLDLVCYLLLAGAYWFSVHRIGGELRRNNADGAHETG